MNENWGRKRKEREEFEEEGRTWRGDKDVKYKKRNNM